MEGQELVFSFEDCRGAGSLPLDEISVYRDNDGPEGRPPICTLVVEAHRRGQSKLPSWDYGTAPAGYKLLRCQPLVPSQRYSINTIGSGVGARRFAVAQDGTARGTDAKCR
jgi:hypothetical protein